MIDHHRRARSICIPAAALAMVVTLTAAAGAQSPSPAPSASPSAGAQSPSAAPPAGPSAAPSASPSAGPSLAPTAPVALLLPSTTDTRWEGVDRPAFAAKLAEVCPATRLVTDNAAGDAATQAQQAQAAIAAGAKVLVLAAVDPASASAIVSTAQAAGAKVISYDTLITGASPDYHIGYDAAAVGSLVADAVLTSNTEAGASASPSPAPSAGTMRAVLIGGPASDSVATAWTAKVKEALGPGGTVVNEGVVTDETAAEGERLIQAAIAAVGTDGFDAVITRDDAVAAGVIAGLTAAGIEPSTRQVAGGDATVSGVQQVLIDQQLLTTFAAPTPEAQLAAVVACGLASGTGLPEGLTTTALNNGTADIPTLPLTAIVVTKDGSIAGTRSVADSVITQKAFGPDTTSQVCSGDYLTACTDLGIALPSASPSPGPSGATSPVPSAAPSPVPSAAPSPVPSAVPSPVPSAAPSAATPPVSPGASTTP